MAKGDHLYVSRGTYFHHGIDCGDGTVVHYQEGEAITQSSRHSFAQGSPIQVKPYEQADPPDQIVARALSRIGERDYHLVFNNCEHFATWCKIGEHRSTQVNQVAAAIGVGGVLLGGPLAVPAIAAAGLYGITKHLEQAQETQDPFQAQKHLDSALTTLSQACQEHQDKITDCQKQIDSWKRTAFLALEQNREDLARAALAKKYDQTQQLQTLQTQWEQMAALQEQIRTRYASGPAD